MHTACFITAWDGRLTAYPLESRPIVMGLHVRNELKKKKDARTLSILGDENRSKIAKWPAPMRRRPRGILQDAGGCLWVQGGVGAGWPHDQWEHGMPAAQKEPGIPSPQSKCVLARPFDANNLT